MKKLKEDIINDKVLKYFFIISIIIFILPSILYIIKEHTIIDFKYGFTYIFEHIDTIQWNIANAIIYFSIFSLIFVIYFFIIRKYKDIFKTDNSIFIYIAIITILFSFMLPTTSTDIFYYMAVGWNEANYDVNPYYSSINDTLKENLDDEILNRSPEIWRNITVVYGPLWPIICKCLTSLSMGSADLALIFFKILNIIVHILNSYLIYKITRKKIFPIIYGLNPLVLFEGIANVHNDIYVAFFILLAIYFVYRKKNILLSIISLGLATTIKYFAILLLPILILYYYRKCDIKDRIKECVKYGLVFIAIVMLIYLVYMQDFTIFKGISDQQGKISKSLYVFTLLADLYKNTNITYKLIQIITTTFCIMCVSVLFPLLFNKQIKFRHLIKKYNMLLIIFIFIAITNFQIWYIIWLFPTMFWLKGRDIHNILNITVAYELANIVYIGFGKESWTYDNLYVLLALAILAILSYAKKINKNKEEKLLE